MGVRLTSLTAQAARTPAQVEAVPRFGLYEPANECLQNSSSRQSQGNRLRHKTRGLARMVNHQQLSVPSFMWTEGQVSYV